MEDAQLRGFVGTWHDVQVEHHCFTGYLGELAVFRDQDPASRTQFRIIEYRHGYLHGSSGQGTGGASQMWWFDSSRDLLMPWYAFSNSNDRNCSFEIQSKDLSHNVKYRFKNLSDVLEFQSALTCYDVFSDIQDVHWDMPGSLQSISQGSRSRIQLWTASQLTDQSTVTAHNYITEPALEVRLYSEMYSKPDGVEAATANRPLIVIYDRGTGKYRYFCIQLGRGIHIEAAKCECRKKPRECCRVVIEDREIVMHTLEREDRSAWTPNLGILSSSFHKRQPSHRDLAGNGSVETSKGRELVFDFHSVNAKEIFVQDFGSVLSMRPTLEQKDKILNKRADYTLKRPANFEPSSRHDLGPLAQSLELSRQTSKTISNNRLMTAVTSTSSSFGGIPLWTETDLGKDDLQVLAKGKDHWVAELTDMGYSKSEITLLLAEVRDHAPWISFTPSERFGPVVRVDYHRRNCVHQGGDRTEVSPVASLAQLDTQSLINPMQSEKSESKDLPATFGDATRSLIAEFTGLGGVIQDLENQWSWFGRVIFELNESDAECSVTYKGSHIPLEKCLSILGSGQSLGRDFEDLRTGVGLSDRQEFFRCIFAKLERKLNDLLDLFGILQGSNLCCDSFTVLVLSTKLHAIEIVRIDYDVIYHLTSRIRNMTRHGVLKKEWDSTNLSVSELKRVLGQILGLFGMKKAKTELIGPAAAYDILNYCAMAIQLLCLGILSYSVGHVGALRPFFLDRPLRKVDILGLETEADPTHASLRLCRLTCLNGLVKDKVLAFGADSAFRKMDAAKKYDIFACAEDLIDTWGPGRFIQKQSLDPSTEIRAIEIAGGCISRQADSLELHFTLGSVPLNEALRPFDTKTKYLIGAAKHNTHCPLIERNSVTRSAGLLHNLGTRREYFQLIERQLQLQAGQYFVIDFGNVWRKQETVTIKDETLDRWHDSLPLPFLMSPWGVQISLCTGVAQRISLLALLSQVLETYVNATVPIPKGWQELLHTHKILDNLRDPCGIAAWFRNLPAELQILTVRLIRSILEVLRYTGFDTVQEELVVAWVFEDDPYRCVRVPCSQANLWARILADSEHCATFAVFTSKCLETSNHPCRGLPNVACSRVTASLDTAVCHLQENGGFFPSDRCVAVGTEYFIGKRGTNLKAKLQDSPGTGENQLIVSQGRLPESIQRRLRRIPRLRERQHWDPHAQEVVILACPEN